MSKAKILLQLDSDPKPSVFDAVVAIDAGAERLLQYGGVGPNDVQGLVHGAMFTRGPQDLSRTAVFIGGSQVDPGEEILAKVQESFFGPFRVSVMLDANGANTTAVAAVIAAARHVPLAGANAVVLAGTGPVGMRVGRLLASEGANVRLGSRTYNKAAAAVAKLETKAPGGSFLAGTTATTADLENLLKDASIVIAAGAAGVELLPLKTRQALPKLRVAIDLNAVPPVGIAGIEPGDKAQERGGVICYGALGVGGTKMKIHKAAIAQLFSANNHVLDAEEIFSLGKSME